MMLRYRYFGDIRHRLILLPFTLYHYATYSHTDIIFAMNMPSLMSPGLPLDTRQMSLFCRHATSQARSAAQHGASQNMASYYQLRC